MRRGAGLAGLLGLLAACSGPRTVLQQQQGTFAPSALAVGGGMPLAIAEGQNGPSGITVDATSVYWTNMASGSGGTVMKRTPKL